MLRVNMLPNKACHTQLMHNHENHKSRYNADEIFISMACKHFVLNTDGMENLAF